MDIIDIADHHLKLVASASPPPGEDLAGQGEPVAWAYEWNEGEFDIWHLIVSQHKPAESGHIRNIRPLYAAPAPSRPAEREEIAKLIAEATGKPFEPHPNASAHANFPQKEAWLRAADAVILALRDAPRDGGHGPFAIGARVRKVKGSSWQGRVCGFYSTDLTPEGVCVESEREPGSVQIYPASALEPVSPASSTPQYSEVMEQQETNDDA